MSIRLMSPHSCEERSEVGSSVSVSSFRSKYEPQRSLHEQVADVFSRPVRRVPSRGHEIPEPLMCPSPHRRPHTSGTKLPPCFSPIRPSERSRKLYSRATSPVMLRHGRHIPVDMISVKYKYPLNQIAYERPSTLASSLHNASLPSGTSFVFIYTTRCHTRTLCTQERRAYWRRQDSSLSLHFLKRSSTSPCLLNNNMNSRSVVAGRESLPKLFQLRRPLSCLTMRSGAPRGPQRGMCISSICKL
mmetsp:Transcript_23407/g.34346  ORF Transcript_23407/g.34346 Transcript_23407/m.34346 type:complete len:245 (-) Transcript_23407:170-904(-)